MIKRKDGFNGERALVLPLSVVQEMEKDALSSVLHITDIGYYPKALHHFRERTEPISQFVFIYCIEGAGWFRTNEQEYAVKANQYFYCPQEYLMHTVRTKVTHGQSIGYISRESWLLTLPGKPIAR